MKKTSKNTQNGWSWVPLKQVLFTSSGGTPATDIKNYWQNGTIPWINSGALRDALITVPTTYITQEALDNSSAKIFPKNSVVIALYGATLGKVGLLDFECSTNQAVTGIYPSEYLNPKLLFYYFRFIREHLIAKAVGAAQPNIKKEIVDSTIIPIPPAEHQAYLVGQLDRIHETFARLEQRSLEIDLLENNAFQGFLYHNSQLFPVVKLGKFCEHRTARIGKDWRGKRLIGVSKEQGITDLRISGKKSFEKYKVVMPGDFIYNPMRVNIGSISIYEEKEIALTSPDYIVFHINEGLSKRFLLKYLKSDLGLSEINKNTRGSVRSRLYFDYLENITIPYCGINLQKKADEILKNFDKIKAETGSMLSSTQQVIKSAYKRFFDEKNFKTVATNDLNDLVTLMSNERNTHMLAVAGRKKVRMKKSITSDENGLSDLISQQFAANRFTFDQLHNVSSIEYEPLKELVFNLIGRQSLLLEFDEGIEKMFLKAKVK